MQDRIAVSSAGLAARQGGRASDHSLLAMRECGLSLAEHQASVLTPELVGAADLVLTMTAGHKQAIVQSMRAAEAKVYTLAEYAGAGADIPDPFGGDLTLYRECAEAMKKNIGMIWDKLRILSDHQYTKKSQ